MQWGLPRRLVTVQLSPPDVLISSHLSSNILEPLNELFFLLVSASQRPISRLLFAAGSWRGVSSSFHRRHRPSSSSSSVVVVVVHRRRRPSSSSSSIVVVITHHRHHTLLPSHSPLYSHVIAIFILVSSLFAIVSSPPTQPITIVYSLTVLMPIPTVVYSSPLNPDRTIVAVCGDEVGLSLSAIICSPFLSQPVFQPHESVHVHTALSCWHVKLPFP